MKKLIVLICVVLVSFTGIAQGVDFGVKAGVNFATLNDATGFSNRTGFVAGIFVGGKFNDNIGIQADLLYSQQGGEFNLGDFNTDYVNVPVVLKYYIAQGLHAQLGPQFGVIINDDTQTVVGETINDIATNNFDISGIVGLGYDLPMGIRLEGRYNFGFTDVPKDVKGKNSVITLSVGYSFL